MGRKKGTGNKARTGKPAARLGLLFVAVVFVLTIKALWGGGGDIKRECASQPEGKCRVYYLLNVDGMKGLGHSALLLVDENREGQLFSYNGMEYNLFQCLLGKEGMGRMKRFFLDRETLKGFLENGELSAGEYQECSNFDRALWREISREEYALVEEQALCYIEAEEEYGQLAGELFACGEGDDAWQEAKERMESFKAREDTPLYQIYTHNCDTAAREIIAKIDGDMAAYNETEERLTPKGNFKNMCRKLGEAWESGTFGENTWVERLLY